MLWMILNNNVVYSNAPKFHRKFMKISEKFLASLYIHNNGYCGSRAIYDQLNRSSSLHFCGFKSHQLLIIFSNLNLFFNQIRYLNKTLIHAKQIIHKILLFSMEREIFNKEGKLRTKVHISIYINM